jgi:hypothetical protein
MRQKSTITSCICLAASQKGFTMFRCAADAAVWRGGCLKLWQHAAHRLLRCLQDIHACILLPPVATRYMHSGSCHAHPLVSIMLCMRYADHAVYAGVHDAVLHGCRLETRQVFSESCSPLTPCMHACMHAQARRPVLAIACMYARTGRATLCEIDATVDLCDQLCNVSQTAMQHMWTSSSCLTAQRGTACSDGCRLGSWW